MKADRKAGHSYRMYVMEPAEESDGSVPKFIYETDFIVTLLRI